MGITCYTASMYPLCIQLIIRPIHLFRPLRELQQFQLLQEATTGKRKANTLVQLSLTTEIHYPQAEWYPPQIHAYILIPGNCEHYFICERGICRCNQVKGLEMRRSFWLMGTIPKSNDKCPYKSEAEGDLTDRRGGGRMTIEAAIRVIQATISWKREKQQTLSLSL